VEMKKIAPIPDARCLKLIRASILFYKSSGAGGLILRSQNALVQKEESVRATPRSGSAFLGQQINDYRPSLQCL